MAIAIIISNNDVPHCDWGPAVNQWESATDPVEANSNKAQAGILSQRHLR